MEAPAYSATETLRDGRQVTLRAVRPEDRDDVRAAIKRLSAESRYMRFMAPLNELSPQMLERAVNPVPGRELQMVAVGNVGGREAIVGGARCCGGVESGGDCEFALAVADDWQGVGLARRLLQALMRLAGAAGFNSMEGYILSSNKRMLGLARRLGFERVASPEGPTVQLVRRELAAAE